MNQVKSRIQVHCILLKGDVPNERPMPTSCGLDFWQSPAALDWLKWFLKAEATMITVTKDSRSARLWCLLRRLPFGYFLASAYPYGAITGDVELFWENGFAISTVLRKHRVIRLEIPFTGEYTRQLSLLRENNDYFRLVPQLNAVRHVLDMEPAQGDQGWFLRQLAPNTRWAIRKAERVGCKVRQATRNDIGTIQMLYAATMRAKGAPVHYGAERFKGMLGQLSNKGYAKIYIGQIGENPAGMAAVVDAAISRHFIQLAVPSEGHASRLSELLVATAIQESLGEGKRYFDFMASTPKDKGLMAYKAKWATHAEPIRYVVLRVQPLLDFAIDFGRWINIQLSKTSVYIHRKPLESGQRTGRE